ncbi:NADH-quinone oxidoreductase [Thalassotalea insulae]|uniref:NADH-quinone oxidoreductase subunit G n=2 Tax=Thalassotalea insulae TaxID=2056778 RepID=A0ABQ6GS51_9GAMM|nr:NADH-quinone oxidoreductase [Thalassotalea insulae]
MGGINMVEKENNKVTIYIDDQPYQVASDNNLLAGVLSQKLNLPYFCWHPSMGSVGACRQCAVTQYQDENDQRGRLVMACTTPVTEGMRIGLTDKSAVEFREQVIAAMMTNHPHDCPVCAEGGECHLQDMTVMTGHTQRQYQGEKRTFTNQYLGEFIGHEMNRCITCYRCVRYYKDYAGGDDFDVFGSKNQVYFGRQQDGQLESEFSGNLVEVCPTGVFTNKLFSAHYTRKWDLQSAPSVCAHCTVGCNTSVGERYGSVRRVMNRYNQQINGYFLCDRGRFGIGFVNSEYRLKSVKGIAQHAPDKLTKLDVSKALVHFKNKRFLGIGSARASYEANYLLKQLVGNDRFSLGLSKTQMQLAALHHQYLAKNNPVSIAEIEQSDFVLIVDEDITQTAPRMALAVRQALRNISVDKAARLGVPSWQDSAVRTIGGKQLSPLYLLQRQDTKLDSVAQQVLLQSSQCTIELLILMAELVKGHTPLTELTYENEGVSSLLNKLVQAKKPLIIGGWNSGSAQLFAAVLAFIDALTEADIPVRSVMVAPQANSVGLLSLLDEQSLPVETVLEQLKEGSKETFDGVIFLEQELSQFSTEQLISLQRQDLTIIALDHSENQITEIADIVLPVAPVTESDGHFVNYQGVIQSFYQVHPSVLPVQESWRWLGIMAESLFNTHPLANEAQSLAALHQMFRQHDNNWPVSLADNEQAIARESHRVSGRTAKMANISVHETKATQSSDSYRFSMEGTKAKHGDSMPYTWAPGWNSNQAITQYQQQVAGPLLNQGQQQVLNFSLNPALLAQFYYREQISDEASEFSSFALKTTWYQGEWQASLTPEFKLLEQYNQLVISNEMAVTQGWQQGQWLAVNCTLDNSPDPVQVIAVLDIDERLVGDLTYGQFNELVNQPVSQVTIGEASEQQVKDYQTEFEQKHTEAKVSQSTMLAQLKQQDQYIPIRLVSGGLDDV